MHPPRLSLLLALTSLVACSKETAVSEPFLCATDPALVCEGVHDEPLEWDTFTEITFDGDTITVGDEVIPGSTLTLTSAGTYSLSGSLDDGQLIVDTKDEELVRLVFDGVEIHCSTNAPLFVAQAEELQIYLSEGSENLLTDGSTYVYAEGEDEPNGALFSKADLLISGPGALRVEGNANDGIVSKDSLIVSNGLLSVFAVDDGIRGKDSVQVLGGVIQVQAGGDGLKSDNDEDSSLGNIQIEQGTLEVTSVGDALAAESQVLIEGGCLTLSAGGGSSATLSAEASAKGIKGLEGVSVLGGSVTIDAADDGLHSNGFTLVEGGLLCIASGDDGIHAEESLTIAGGDTTITSSYEGLESSLLTIDEGTLHIIASDDGLNVTSADSAGLEGPGRDPHGGTGTSCDECQLVINGGYLAMDAGGDGLDSNGSIEMNGGLVLVHGPTESMNGPADIGDGGSSSFIMNGGTLVAVGSSGMAIAPDSSSTQYSVLVNLDAQDAGTLFHLETASGRSILTFAPRKSYESVLFSSSTLGRRSYEVALGGSSSGTPTDGLYQGGSYKDGEDTTEFTVTSITTTVGERESGGPPGH